MVINVTIRVRDRFRASTLCMQEEVEQDTRVIRNWNLKNRWEASSNIFCKNKIQGISMIMSGTSDMLDKVETGKEIQKFFSFAV